MDRISKFATTVQLFIKDFLIDLILKILEIIKPVIKTPKLVIDIPFPVLTVGGEKPGLKLEIDLNEFINRYAGYFLNKMTVAYPAKIPKGYSSKFAIILYPEALEQQINNTLVSIFGKTLIEKPSFPVVNLKPDMEIEIELSSPDFDFSYQKKIIYRYRITQLLFLGKSKGDLAPGVHEFLITIKEAQTSHEIFSMPLQALVVDYALDSISRPVLSNIVSIITGIASVVSYLLTILQNIDKVTGITAGSTLLLLTALIFGRSHFLYRKLQARQTLNTP